MGNRKLATAVTVLTACLALIGCASTAAPEPRPTVSVADAPESTGTKLAELRDLYVDAGGHCEVLTLRVTTVAEEAGDCDDGALLTTYGSEAQRDGAIHVLEELQVTNPSPHVIAVGPDWIVNGSAVESLAAAMGGVERQIGDPRAAIAAQFDLTTDAGICAADAELTNLELNDALAPLLGFPADRDQRSSEQDEAIRAYKNAAFIRECPARAS